ncbi:uncharacterized protein ASPGLDRAFT_1492193 [Aspergillus glaucus CBS 516.65]|uniref:Uncharacterized protein n=1 Tax=Aspergillus glaucus CBS 516.65 TaxID=1160497 RepID=A0A1L9VJ61_ASPGL|nr:hypothetical protein ASPGLDRAFT_1492193 [Aspergillus glaucus CBS 516.65]OJJ83934.1 hypothetical protein ASPGLDRAFT_1492193 [Aspergillus glaucus CBS 516.65]
MDQEQPFDPDISAQLYNRIICIGLGGAQRSLRGRRLQTNWFNTWVAHPEAAPYVPQWLTRFPAPISSFLEQIYLVIDTHGVPVAISPPTRLQPVEIEDLDDCVLLLGSNLSTMTDSIGLVMDVSDLRVSYIHDRLDWDENENQPWYSFQLFLERLNAIIDVGKYRPVPPDNDIVVPWNDWVLKQSVEAFDALVKAIEARLPQETSHDRLRQPIATQETLNPAVNGFPRAFLLRATKPHFKYITPGIKVCDTEMPPPQIEIHHPSRGDPVFRTPYYREFNGTPAVSDAIILFPAAEARYRERQVGLWGQGSCPFYVDHDTRLVSLLRKWTELVDDGVWTVGEDGVEGGMEFYRQAEDPEKTDWFVLREECFDLGWIACHTTIS